MEPLVEYVERVDVWAATIEDKPGGLGQALATLRDAGADLQLIIARRAEPGKGVVFVTPLRGDRKMLQPHRWVLTLRIPSIPFESWALIGQASLRS
jgi:hypothetical protein